MSEQSTLPGFDDLAAQDEQITYDEAQRISVAAREAFEDALDERPECAPLQEPFVALLEQGWPWRKALYISWAKLPLRVRWPRTQEALAELMGLRSVRTISRWREKNPGIDLMVNLAVGRRVAGVVSEQTGNILSKVYEVGMTEGYRGQRDRRTWLEVDGVLTERVDMQLTAVDADKMAAAQQQAQDEAGTWQAGRFELDGFDRAVEATMQMPEDDDDAEA